MPARPPLLASPARRLLIGLAALVVGLALARSAARAETLDGPAWRTAHKGARKLMKVPGQRFPQQTLSRTLAEDDSARAAELMVRWTVASLKLQQGVLTRERDERKIKLEKLRKILLKAYPKMPPTRLEDKNNWDIVKNAHDLAVRNYEDETGVRYTLGQGLGAVRDPAAVAWLLEDGLPTLQKAKGSESVQVALARGLAEQPKAQVLPTLLAMASDASRVKLQLVALHWFGQHKHPEGFAPLVAALKAKPVAVRRLAVHGLKQLDDPRAVEPLIQSMSKADGLLNAEIDDVLHWFTSKSFEGSAPVWKRWWKAEGAAWLASAPTERHTRRREDLPGGTRVRFYGIPTESKHVVFVLDRSGSMKAKASDAAIARKKAKPKGPITGDGGKRGKGKGAEEALAGETRMELAKNQLKRSIGQLDRKVKFGVLFYSNDVKVWKPAPELVPAVAAQKKAAVTWFEGLGPEGPTLMFPALMKALAYADTIGEDTKKPRTGANTIFLLSDGSPTTADGKVLPADELEAAMEAFLEANKLYRCIVHTIGIGPGHNSAILRRIAAATGGQYKAAGTR